MPALLAAKDNPWLRGELACLPRIVSSQGPTAALDDLLHAIHVHTPGTTAEDWRLRC